MKRKDFDPKKSIDLYDLLELVVQNDNISYPMIVKCTSCGALHSSDTETFFTVWGNVTAGIDGGVVGNNFDENGNLTRVSFFCRHPKCVDHLIEMMSGK